MTGTLHQHLETILQEATDQLTSGLNGAKGLPRQLSELARDFDQVRPGVLLYGYYNSGKSTLINALLGAETASTSDSPCTDKVTEYRWQGITLLDSAGIDAPIEHEQVTAEHVARFQAIAFVISTAGGSEEERTVREIERMLAWKKDVIIILNNKSGLDFTKPEEQRQAIAELAALRDSLHARISWPGGRKPPIMLVNAKTALKAKLEGKTALYEMSGMPDVERALVDVFRRASGNRLLMPIVERLARWFDAAEQEYDLLRTVHHDKADDLVKSLANLRRVRGELVRRFETDLVAQAGYVGRRMLNRIKQGESVDGEVDGYIRRAEGALRSRLQQALDELGVAVNMETMGFAEAASDGGLGEGITTSSGDERPRQQNTSDENSLIRKVDPKNIGHLIRSRQGEEIIRQGLLKLRGLGVPGIKGRWTLTLNRWSKNLARGVGHCVEVALMAWQLAQARKAQKDYEDLMKRQHQEMVDETHQFVGHLQTTVLSQASDWVRDIFRPIEADFETSIAAAQGGSGTSQKSLAEISRLRAELEELAAHMCR
ncbi:MAG TPA: 50S ribosome-binding GTPase [Candidatus Ozemobacteraceae bacterium]|nr:50S ribosome-binding GTPase [Candidatus Ozemobacteraceae bacterium]